MITKTNTHKVPNRKEKDLFLTVCLLTTQLPN